MLISPVHAKEKEYKNFFYTINVLIFANNVKQVSQIPLCCIRNRTKGLQVKVWSKSRGIIPIGKW
jgi:hypothetical protein